MVRKRSRQTLVVTLSVPSNKLATAKSQDNRRNKTTANHKGSWRRWTDEEKNRLQSVRIQHPKKTWRDIQEEFFPDRTEKAVMKEHSKLHLNMEAQKNAEPQTAQNNVSEAQPRRNLKRHQPHTVETSNDDSSDGSSEGGDIEYHVQQVPSSTTKKLRQPVIPLQCSASGSVVRSPERPYLGPEREISSPRKIASHQISAETRAPTAPIAGSQTHQNASEMRGPTSSAPPAKTNTLFATESRNSNISLETNEGSKPEFVGDDAELNSDYALLQIQVKKIFVKAKKNCETESQTEKKFAEMEQQLKNSEQRTKALQAENLRLTNEHRRDCSNFESEIRKMMDELDELKKERDDLAGWKFEVQSNLHRFCPNHSNSSPKAIKSG
ncbi:hypothetical protein BGW36DRAFT_356189 [Talaromyces proteolyticus]|uniref:Uncharacterized protein n=1 Tax=Talaromyces proteolyticus TaxID=1131652 RepID=A0AAD4L2J4_9EURO|nr:uncharacterized protein BGW36DRAFT_356189 [Talaromyces proteolyticus]KAH8702044.1 hypothetical protein BGW36DRAFT_356189 [Talaromyces proteolyticus]